MRQARALGPGIRINRDDDNDNGLPDRSEGGLPIPLENDLIEVRVDRLPGQGDLVLEPGFGLQVYYSYDKETPIPYDDDVIFTEPLPFVNDTVSIFVEWVGINHGTDTLGLVDPVTMMVIDTLVFHTFTSLTVVLGGFTQVPSVPTDPNHGMFLVADRLYAQGFDVMKFDEDEVFDGITSHGPAGDGIPYEEIRNAVNNRSVDDIALLGYSQGGGSVYNLSEWLDDQNTVGDIGQFNLEFTAYVDAVRDDGPSAEDRLPVNTQWHVNLYQRLDDVLDGTTVPGSNDDLDVEQSPFFPFDEISHSDIDDAIDVMDWVLMRYFQEVER